MPTYHEFDPSYYCEARYIEEIAQALDRKGVRHDLLVTSSLDRLPPAHRPRVVILTGDEREQLPPEGYIGQDVVAVFRIFNRAFTANQVNVFPIPPGYNWRMHNLDDVSTMDRFYPERPLSQRETDVFFFGQVVASRKPMLERAKRLGPRIKTVLGTSPSFRTGLKIDDYLRQLGNTKIALAPDGTSEDTFRFVEAMASGCVVVLPRKSDLWYYRDAPVVWVDSWSELTPKFVRAILESDLDSWGRRARDYYETHLSGEAVADYIDRTVRTQLTPEAALKTAIAWQMSAKQATETLMSVKRSFEYRAARALLSGPKGLVKKLLGR